VDFLLDLLFLSLSRFISVRALSHTYTNTHTPSVNSDHQQHACHFKMPFWLVDRPKSHVDKVNMAEIPVNTTLPCIQCETIPIQDTVLSTGYIVLLTGQPPCSHGLPCQQGNTMSTGHDHVNRGVPCEQGSTMLTGASSCQHDVFACLHATVVLTSLILSTDTIGMSTGQCLSTGIICIST
jgi:hypothetical protein